MEIEKAFEDRILPILRCLVCPGDAPLHFENGPAAQSVEGQQWHKHLECGKCGTAYPITDDFIPVFLTPVTGLATGSEAWHNLTANVAVYDATSDQYETFTRQSEVIGQRLRTELQRLHAMGAQIDSNDSNGTRPPLHLDFGCGPGHVLKWLCSAGYLQIGMDISLANLRNTRRTTGAIVICGDACAMPFINGSIDLITESASLHHIYDWKKAVNESGRVCKRGGGIIIDDEPSKEQMAWSRLAVAVFNARFPVYWLLSYVLKEKYIFRDRARAKLNLLAEIHHQPGTGFSLQELGQLFLAAGFESEIIVSPTPELTSRASPAWYQILISILSARNPWNPEYGTFMALAVRRN